jgi:hypothetical protein
VTTTGSGDIQLPAQDTSALDARGGLSSKAEAGFWTPQGSGTSIGASVAFNAIGWDPGNAG